MYTIDIMLEWLSKGIRKELIAIIASHTIKENKIELNITPAGKVHIEKADYNLQDILNSKVDEDCLKRFRKSEIALILWKECVILWEEELEKVKVEKKKYLLYRQHVEYAATLESKVQIKDAEIYVLKKELRKRSEELIMAKNKSRILERKLEKINSITETGKEEKSNGEYDIGLKVLNSLYRMFK